MYQHYSYNATTGRNKILYFELIIIRLGITDESNIKHSND